MTTHGEVNWVFTDDRLEDVRIVCHGRCTFNIWVRGEIPGYHSEDGWTNTDCFTSYDEEHVGGDGYDVRYSFAQERAEEHFEYMWHEMMGTLTEDGEVPTEEDEDEEEEEEEEEDDDD